MMLEQFQYGLRIIAMAPICGLIFHLAAFISAWRKSASLAADSSEPRLSLVRRFLPLQRIAAIYALCVSATSLLAALETQYFRLRFGFGVLFLIFALLALRFEHKAKLTAGKNG